MRHGEMIVWAAGEDTFRLGIGELRAIEQRSDAGVSVVLMRLLGGAWKVDDVINPIRLGLIGGGLSEADARKKVDAATESANLYELAVTAAEVMRRFVIWEGDDQPGEAPAGQAETTSPRSPTAEPDGQPTTELAPSSASLPETSTT
ncbi:hypothetical protein MesoLjLc_45700 [Mesorhizobium sp. L-8-10]|uniref:gene transfer agent family protein n=1 Tax=Mesorhizobium sp. L-8-10 TaxID=2744523 RepID=UPI0019274BDD|nr:gene transfer agent family protein [Mesorhizobium sp. L-8-10]BCH32640.1 hypothetical protein MesoLjLc_45700 [Mesorhizobium sp. L-8-10]